MAQYGAGTGSDLSSASVFKLSHFALFVSQLFVNSCQFIDFWTYAFSYKYLYCSSSFIDMILFDGKLYILQIYILENFSRHKIDMLQTRYNCRGENGGEADETKAKDESA